MDAPGLAAPAPAGARSLLRLQRRTFEALEVAAPGDSLSRALDIFLVTLIGLNVVAMVVGTVPAIDARFRGQLAVFEIASVVVFTGEYLARLWSARADPRFSGSGGRMRFAGSPMAIIDLLAVLPFWLPFVGVDLRVLRVLRLFRIFRIAKLTRYSAALQVLADVARARRVELALAASMGGMVLLVASTLMYFAEHEVQPEAFSSIPAAMWWAVATLTTVGYGDVVPVTVLGRLLGASIAVAGIGMFALPTGILGAAFTEELQARRTRTPGSCPACGK